MHHPNFIDTIPTDYARLHEARVHQPDPRPKWAFRFTVVIALIAAYAIYKLPFTICPI